MYLPLLIVSVKTQWLKDICEARSARWVLQMLPKIRCVSHKRRNSIVVRLFKDYPIERLLEAS